MTYEDLTTEIQTRIATITDYYGIYIVPDFAALVLMKNTNTPIVGIIPGGLNNEYIKGNRKKVTYTYNIHIIQEIWTNGESEVLIGGNGKKGLFELMQDLYDLLKDYTFNTELSSSEIYLANINNVSAPRAYTIGNSTRSKDACSMGLNITYKEITT